MAQDAVNIVDSLDRDNIATRFEYDLDPRNGWGLDDYPYSTSDTDRGEVWGVERLDLTLSEALVVHSPAETGINHNFTQWDDGNDQNFCYVEISNPGPDRELRDLDRRLEVGPNITVSTTDQAKIRRLNFRGDTVPAGTHYTIASTDNAQGSANFSVMKVARSGMPPMDWDTDTTTWIAPAQRNAGT